MSITESDDGRNPLSASLKLGWRPAWADAALGALTQEKGTKVPERPRRPSYLAGFTCPKCPHPYRPLPWCICEPLEPPEGYQAGWDPGTGHEPLCACEKPTRYTERCNTCAARIKKWMRGKKDVEDVQAVAWAREYAGRSWRLVFLTLTTPNAAAGAVLEDEVRSFKRQVASWRRTVGVKNHFLGGFDYYEVTENQDDGSMNVHMHGVWVMSSWWDQARLQDSWGRGIAHIKTVKGARSAIRYVTAYLGKAPIPGVRTRERWGRCRGDALSAIHALRQTVVTASSDAGDAAASDEGNDFPGSQDDQA